MKKISYQFPVEVNIGTENDPNVRVDLYHKEFICTEENYESALAIAKAEAYNGEVTVEEVEDEPVSTEPTADELIDILLGRNE